MPEKFKPPESLNLVQGMEYLEVFKVIKGIIIKYFLTPEQKNKQKKELLKRNNIFPSSRYTNNAINKISEYLTKSLLEQSNPKTGGLKSLSRVILPSVKKSEIERREQEFYKLRFLNKASEVELVQVCEHLLNNINLNEIGGKRSSNEYLTARDGENTLVIYLNEFGVITPDKNTMNFISPHPTQKVKEVKIKQTEEKLIKTKPTFWWQERERSD